MPFLDPVVNIRRIGTSAAVIVTMILRVTILVPVSVMAVIIMIVIIMIPVVIMPVERTPGTPIRRVITVIPGRMPYCVSGKENKPNQRPCCYFKCGGSGYDNRLVGIGVPITRISRIGRFIKNGFDNVIPAI